MEENKIFLIIGLIIIIIIAGCTSPSETNTANDCTTKDCFISLSNECKDITITVNEDAGVFKYSSSDCVFTKTLVSLNEEETDEMKNLLQGKSLTCRYENGKFDQRLVDTLIFGTESCEGELKEILVRLLVFD